MVIIRFVVFVACVYDGKLTIPVPVIELAPPVSSARRMCTILPVLLILLSSDGDLSSVIFFSPACISCVILLVVVKEGEVSGPLLEVCVEL